MSVKEAWEEIGKMKDGGGVAKKREVLSLFVKDFQSLDSHMWQDRLLEIKEEISMTEEKSIKKSEFTRGELIQQHGFEEAIDMIRKGKFQEAKDRWGDTIYIKSKREYVESAKRTKTVELTRTASFLKNINAFFCFNIEQSSEMFAT